MCIAQGPGVPIVMCDTQWALQNDCDFAHWTLVSMCNIWRRRLEMYVLSLYFMMINITIAVVAKFNNGCGGSV